MTLFILILFLFYFNVIVYFAMPVFVNILFRIQDTFVAEPRYLKDWMLLSAYIVTFLAIDFKDPDPLSIYLVPNWTRNNKMSFTN